jgi:hypothetical protein
MRSGYNSVFFPTVSNKSFSYSGDQECDTLRSPFVAALPEALLLSFRHVLFRGINLQTLGQGVENADDAVWCIQPREPVLLQERGRS